MLSPALSVPALSDQDHVRGPFEPGGSSYSYPDLVDRIYYHALGREDIRLKDEPVGRYRCLCIQYPEPCVDQRPPSSAYEAANFRFKTASQGVALATRELFAGWFPVLLRPLVRRSIHALLDQALLTAFDLRPAPRWLAWAAERALRARASALRWLPQRRRPKLRTQIPRADYPQGYRIESLGPPPPGSRDEDRAADDDLRPAPALGRGNASDGLGSAYHEDGAPISVCPFADRRLKGGNDGQGHGTDYRTRGE